MFQLVERIGLEAQLTTQFFSQELVKLTVFSSGSSIPPYYLSFTQRYESGELGDYQRFYYPDLGQSQILLFKNLLKPIPYQLIVEGRGRNWQDITLDVSVANYTEQHYTHPIGSFMWYMGDTAPDGWSVLNGGIAARDDHSLLWDWVQQSGYPVVNEANWVNSPRSFSHGDGQHTFRFPDYRKEFVRGAHDEQSLGTWQGDSTKLLMNGASTLSFPEGDSPTGIIAHQPGVKMIGIYADYWSYYNKRHTLRGAMDTVYGGASETAPRSVALTPLVCG